MTERKEFEMSEDDLARLKEASQPLPEIMMHLPGQQNRQERASAAWFELGNRLGFDHLTVLPGKSERSFSAIARDSGTLPATAAPVIVEVIGQQWCQSIDQTHWFAPYVALQSKQGNWLVLCNVVRINGRQSVVPVKYHEMPQLPV